MYESMKKQRKKFIESLKSNVSEYKANILSDETSNIGCKKIPEDWEKVDADIKNNISIGIYEDLVKDLSSKLENIAKKQYENEK